MDIIQTDDYEDIEVKEEQLLQVSSKSKIEKDLQRDDVIAFYAYENNIKIGFALLKKYSDGFFLWNFIIDHKYQGCSKGKLFLRNLILKIKKDYCAKFITTTYIYGNIVAKKLYTNIGFVETDVVCEDGIHEVNLLLTL